MELLLEGEVRKDDDNYAGCRNIWLAGDDKREA